VPVMRLPRATPWRERVTMARQLLHAFKPDWISLQFVPFGFQRKGLCFGLSKRLAVIKQTAAWHIMFHELWLGLGEQSSVKHRIWGAMQRFIVKDLVNRLRPRVIHTQAEPYRRVLEREGIKASRLRLFGNISYANAARWNGFFELLATSVAGWNHDRAQLYLAGIFGGVHREWDAEQAVSTIIPLVQRFQKRLVMVFFGKNNVHPKRFDELRSKLQDRADVVVAGERIDSEISQILQSLDLGIATSPRQIIQKSGSVAAMLEHGLQVLVTRDDWRLRGEDFKLEETSFHLLSPKQFASLQSLPMRDLQPPGENSVRRVTEQMLRAILLQSP